ncbi:ComF family protein [Candidatus Wolfebacteria bacterium]|nr:ComF family protein [Candidatus Wolfebacteria bacterium]
MILFLIKVKNIIFDILFPPICLNCQKLITDKNNDKEIFLCADCRDKIKLNSSLFCPACRLRLAHNKKICNHPNSQYLLAAAGNYDDEIFKNLIHYFKYQSFENLTPFLGDLILNYLNILNFNFSRFIIISIPLHKYRERRRGFNQANLLGEYVSKKLNLEFLDALKRIKNNEPQAKLKNSEQRIKNMENCFKIKDGYNVNGKNIILIDDVFTTGATMNEAAKILKQNNAKKIIALVLARA